VHAGETPGERRKSEIPEATCSGEAFGEWGKSELIVYDDVAVSVDRAEIWLI